MLRITTITDQSATIRLEGTLAKEWVGKLKAELRHIQGRGFAVTLDLRNVPLVDIAGVRLIKQLVTQGVQIGPCSSCVAERLDAAKLSCPAAGPINRTSKRPERTHPASLRI